MTSLHPDQRSVREPDVLVVAGVSSSGGDVTRVYALTGTGEPPHLLQEMALPATAGYPVPSADCQCVFLAFAEGRPVKTVSRSQMAGCFISDGRV